MFLMGLAVSGKSTAIKIAQQFCYEFCIAVGIMWSDFGGVIISKGCISQSKQSIQC
jgi:hypothetical protein